MAIEITKLRVNYKTLEEFKKFKEYGIQELSMSEDLKQILLRMTVNHHFTEFILQISL